jgi:hypothetical protein
MTTLGITTLSILTFIKMGLIATVMKGVRYNVNQDNTTFHIAMLSVATMNVVMLTIITLNVMVPCSLTFVNAIKYLQA